MPITDQEALARVIDHREIFHDEMMTLMRRIIAGEMSPVMATALLIGMRVKKETIGEIAAAAAVMRELSNKVEVPLALRSNVVGVVGTGGDGAHTFNISTCSMFVAAAAAISPMVAFLTRMPISSAVAITGDISPAMMRRIKVIISS